MLCTIVGYLGTCLKVDNVTNTKSRLMFARVLVDMNVADGFPEELFFYNECDTISVGCWLPMYCAKCFQFGHNISYCRKGQSKANKPLLEVDVDGFRPYRKRFHATISKQVNPMEEVDELDSLSDTSDKENIPNPDKSNSVLEQIAVVVENGFSVLAAVNDTSIEEVHLG